MTSVILTAKAIVRLRRELQSSGRGFEVRDERQRNVVLRFGPHEIVWQVRFSRRRRQYRLRLGDLNEWSIAEARELGSKVFIMVKGGQTLPDEHWVQSQRLEHGKIPPPEEGTAPASIVAAHGWTFATARKKYLDQVRKTRRVDTFRDYRYMLNIDQLRRFEARPVSEIKRIEFGEMVAAIHAAGTERHAAHLASALRPMWRWLGEDAQIRHSQVDPEEMVRLKAPERSLREDVPRPYVPPMDELGRIAAIAQAEVLEPQISAAVLLMTYTAQRRRTIVTAQKEHFRKTLLGGVWSIPARFRKNGRVIEREHVIPLPASVWTVVERAMEVSHDPDSQWLFPQFRPKRAGDQVAHMSASTLTRALLLMPGVRSSPHAVRRSFATHGERQFGLLRVHTSAILDHGEGSEGSDVTATHYALHDGTHHKWPTMQTWCREIDAAIARAKAADSRLEDAAWLESMIDAARYGKPPPSADQSGNEPRRI